MLNYSFVFTLVFAAALVVGLLVRFYLATRQIRHVAQNRSAVPAAFAATISLASHQKAASYTITKARFGLLEMAFGAALLLGWTLLGGIDALNQAINSTSLASYGSLVPQLALLAGFALISGLLDLPFTLYSTFKIEERFGFNKMTFALWLTDAVKGVVLGAVIGLPIVALILWLMSSAGSLWWLWAWFAWMGFNLLVLVLYPTVIAPLFNKFKPLEDGNLKTSIQALLDRCGFVSKGLFVMDGSKRSAHGNAYFTGIGKNKRIVFFDTLIEKLSSLEIEAVLAHELGHFKKNHIRQRMIMTFLMSLAGLALLGWLSEQIWFYESLGVTPAMDGNNAGLALALFSLVIPTFTYFITPIGSLLSRQHEFEADAFAAQTTHPKHLISALIKLYQDNAATLTPDTWYSAFYDSHPPAPIRIAHLNRLAT